MEAFRGWDQYLAVSIPVTIMICSEWWAFEALTIMAGILGVVELASQTISINVLATLYMVVTGIQEATCSLIGNSIGANNVPLAKRFFKLIMTYTTFFVAIASLILFLFRKQIGSIFTDD